MFTLKFKPYIVHKNGQIITVSHIPVNCNNIAEVARIIENSGWDRSDIELTNHSKFTKNINISVQKRLV